MSPQPHHSSRKGSGIQTQHDFNPKLQPGHRTRGGDASRRRATTEPPSIDLTAAVERLKRLLDERDEDSVSPVPASPNPPTPETSVHSPHSGQEPTPQHDDKAAK